MLPFRGTESLGLPGSYHKFVYTAGLLSNVFTKTALNGTTVTLLSINEALSGKGYVDVEGNGMLWTAFSKMQQVTYLRMPLGN